MRFRLAGETGGFDPGDMTPAWNGNGHPANPAYGQIYNMRQTGAAAVPAILGVSDAAILCRFGRPAVNRFPRLRQGCARGVRPSAFRGRFRGALPAVRRAGMARLRGRDGAVDPALSLEHRQARLDNPGFQGSGQERASMVRLSGLSMAGGRGRQPVLDGGFHPDDHGAAARGPVGQPPGQPGDRHPLCLDFGGNHHGQQLRLRAALPPCGARAASQGGRRCGGHSGPCRGTCHISRKSTSSNTPSWTIAAGSCPTSMFMSVWAATSSALMPTGGARPVRRFPHLWLLLGEGHHRVRDRRADGLERGAASRVRIAPALPRAWPGRRR